MSSSSVASENSCINSGDTTWVLISTILVLGMMPALAFFEAGLLRSKNTLSIITQVFGGFVVLAVMWDFFGYTLVYGTDVGGFIGNLHHVVLLDVPYNDCVIHAPNIPAATFAVFQMMFACITPLLMTGAFAERVKFKAFILLTIFWEILVFYPVAHWIWGDGWLEKRGALDFAGGIVIHTTAGAGALVISLYMGRRKEFDKYGGEFPPSNLPLAALGASLLWMGWFGFNAGSALKSGSVATSTVVSTQIAGSMSGLVWIIISWYRGKPSCIAVLNGVIAGLAGVTPASGYINNQSTIVLGFLLGIGSYGAVYLLKHKLRIDDALDVSSVHGFTGVIGSIFIGFCSEKAINSAGADGLIFGNPKLLGIQILAVVVAGAWAAFWTLVLCIILNRTVGLKLDPEDEDLGLDFVEHGEYAYHDLFITSSEPRYEQIQQYPINHE